MVSTIDRVLAMQCRPTMASLLGSILAGALYLRVRASSLVGSSTSMRQSVAVIGFKNLSGEAREDWLSTALSD